MISFQTFAHLAHIDLGAPKPKPTSIEGAQVEAAKTLWTSPDGKAEVGVWECTPGRFTANRETNSEICHIVQGRDGPVRVPPGFRIRISPDGTVFGADPAQPGAEPNQEVDRIALRDASRTPLSRRVDGLFQVAGQPPGTDIVNGPQPPMLTPQALEGSNMNPVEAMTRLIDHARSFESQIRVVKEMKDIDVSGASMMKPV